MIRRYLRRSPCLHPLHWQAPWGRLRDQCGCGRPNPQEQRRVRLPERQTDPPSGSREPKRFTVTAATSLASVLPLLPPVVSLWWWSGSGGNRWGAGEGAGGAAWVLGMETELALGFQSPLRWEKGGIRFRRNELSCVGQNATAPNDFGPDSVPPYPLCPTSIGGPGGGGVVIIHEHTRVGTELHCTVPVTAHCPALKTGNSIGHIVPSALASDVSGLE